MVGPYPTIPPGCNRHQGRKLSKHVTLLGKPGCHLCEVAAKVVAVVCTETGATWEQISILGDDEMMLEYGEKIPVIMIDGSMHGYWRVDSGRLRDALLR